MHRNTNPKIFILTGPVGIGKSSLLRHFFTLNDSKTCGFLSLIDSVTGKRGLYLLPDFKHITFEHDGTDQDSLKIGRFDFSKQAFDLGLKALKHADENTDFAVIDELGKLEINQDEGFEPLFSTWLAETKATRLIAVIRSSLLQKAIEKYNWLGAEINTGAWMPATAEIIGVVMAGGRSSRMGKDKKWIEYHDVPQWQHAGNMLSKCVQKVVISVNDDLNTEFLTVSDEDAFKNHGPMSGLLSVAKAFPQKALLVFGVDYPSIEVSTLMDLVYTYQVRNCSVCYRNPESERIEPLIALYHPRDISKIESGFHRGEFSLSRFLKSLGDSLIQLTHIPSTQLKSHDLPQDEATFRTR